MLTTEEKAARGARSAAKPRYLLRLTLPKADWDDAWEVCRGIEQCGGHRSRFGFAFCSAAERAAALEILQERFGAQYFESLDIRSDAEAVRILVAASHERRRHWCCAGLARYGFRVAEASDGLECLEAMRRQPPDIVVLHEGLLWGGGEGVLKLMQQDSGWSGIPVVFLSLRNLRNAASPCPTAPAVTCLQAPVALPLLVATIQELVRRAA